MPHQVAVTLAAHVRSGDVQRLGGLLETMGDGVANGTTIDLGSLEGVHFARFVLLEATTDLEGRPLSPLLIYMSDVDVSAERHLSDLVAASEEGLDEIFGCCEEYPRDAQRTRASRLAFLQHHRVKERAFYVNTVGRSRQQIRQEAHLRDSLERFVDANKELQGKNPDEIARALQAHIADDDSLRWATKAAGGLELGFRLREFAHLVAIPVILLLLLPLLLVAAPFYLILLRFHEARDPAPHLKPSAELVQELAALEDHLVHNPFTAVGLVKPGLFRRITIDGVLFGINYATRHVFNRGNLAGVKTIHFARWVFLDDNRRVIFASNYDGSLESYMDDFIDKIAAGLNIVFSNGFGYPKTRWLVMDGARDEQAFKDYLRLHQIPTRVWFSAYGHLTNANIATNEKIRRGLVDGSAREAPRQWLQLL
jgi:hypothetical protein